MSDGSLLITPRQSPIDIRSGDVQHDPSCCKVSSIRIKYTPGDCTHVSTSERGWMVNVKNDCQTHLLGEHLGSAYKLLQFHAHWGPNQAYGSEHKIDGKPTSAEVHFVFWNTRYETVDQAVEKGDGLAVIGVLLKEGGTTNSHYELLVKCIEEAFETKSTVEMPNNFSIEHLLPQPETRDFYTYLGSLTTPPYTECVVWTVFKTPIYVSADQLDVFRKIVPCNVRPCQALADRVVRSSFSHSH